MKVVLKIKSTPSQKRGQFSDTRILHDSMGNLWRQHMDCYTESMRAYLLTPEVIGSENNNLGISSKLDQVDCKTTKGRKS